LILFAFAVYSTYETRQNVIDPYTSLRRRRDTLQTTDGRYTE